MANKVSSPIKEAIRASAILTGDYVAGTVVNVQGMNTVTLEIAFTIGSSTGVDIKVEFSADGTNYFQMPQYTQSGSVSLYSADVIRLAATGTIRPTLGTVNADTMRVSAKAIGTTTGTLLAISSLKAAL